MEYTNREVGRHPVQYSLATYQKDVIVPVIPSLFPEGHGRVWQLDPRQGPDSTGTSKPKSDWWHPERRRDQEKPTTSQTLLRSPPHGPPSGLPRSFDARVEHDRAHSRTTEEEVNWRAAFLQTGGMGSVPFPGPSVLRCIYGLRGRGFVRPDEWFFPLCV